MHLWELWPWSLTLRSWRPCQPLEMTTLLLLLRPTLRLNVHEPEYKMIIIIPCTEDGRKDTGYFYLIYYFQLRATPDLILLKYYEKNEKWNIFRRSWFKWKSFVISRLKIFCFHFISIYLVCKQTWTNCALLLIVYHFTF